MSLTPPEVPPASKTPGDGSIDLSRGKLPVGQLLALGGLLFGALSFAGNYIFSTKVDNAQLREAQGQLRLETQAELGKMSDRINEVSFGVKDQKRDLELMARTLNAVAFKLNVDAMQIAATSSRTVSRVVR